VLVVEDEPRLATVLAEYLERAGYATEHVADGSAVAARVRARTPALVLLDLNLPGRDGLEVCREIRSFSTVPIVMVTARVEEVDRLIGLELGADDYVCKPYSPREVVARVRAVLRRAVAAPAAAGHLRLDRSTLRVHGAAGIAELTPLEFSLLETLHGAPGRIYSREQLMDRIYDDHRIVSDRTIDSHVKKLRRKLLEVTSGAELVHSVYGAGYRYEEPS
jgi:two-component system response regulator BaeR